MQVLLFNLFSSYFCVTCLSPRITMNVTRDVLWLLFLLPILDYNYVVRASGVKRYV